MTWVRCHLLVGLPVIKIDLNVGRVNDVLTTAVDEKLVEGKPNALGDTEPRIPKILSIFIDRRYKADQVEQFVLDRASKSRSFGWVGSVPRLSGTLSANISRLPSGWLPLVSTPVRIFDPATGGRNAPSRIGGA